MIGAICGDIAGSHYEWERTKDKDGVLIFHPGSDFTDDTVLTVAVADAILNKGSYRESIIRYARDYPGRGYGGRFAQFIGEEDPQPYNSFGNGSAMRVSPVGFAFNTEEEVLREARASAIVSHNHPEGIKGAQAVALAIYLARRGESKESIRDELIRRFDYNLGRQIKEIRPTAVFDETCQVSVPEAIIAFLDSSGFEDAIRNAVSLGADADTQAAIAGAIAEAYYGGPPASLREKAERLLPDEFMEIIRAFYHKFAGT